MTHCGELCAKRLSRTSVWVTFTDDPLIPYHRKQSQNYGEISIYLMIPKDESMAKIVTIGVLFSYDHNFPRHARVKRQRHLSSNYFKELTGPLQTSESFYAAAFKKEWSTHKLAFRHNVLKQNMKHSLSDLVRTVCFKMCPRNTSWLGPVTKCICIDCYSGARQGLSLIN